MYTVYEVTVHNLEKISTIIQSGIGFKNSCERRRLSEAAVSLTLF